MDPMEAVTRLFDAVRTREPGRVAACFTTDATFRNMPHEAVSGREGIAALFAPILTRASDVRWDVHTSAVVRDLVFAERTDRFWIDGDEYAIECNGVFRVEEEQELIAEVRDYVDLEVWRYRLGDVLLRGRPE